MICLWRDCLSEDSVWRRFSRAVVRWEKVAAPTDQKMRVQRREEPGNQLSKQREKWVESSGSWCIKFISIGSLLWWVSVSLPGSKRGEKSQQRSFQRREKKAKERHGQSAEEPPWNKNQLTPFFSLFCFCFIFVLRTYCVYY